jgi:hypothetical protein
MASRKARVSRKAGQRSASNAGRQLHKDVHKRLHWFLRVTRSLEFRYS